MDSFYSRTVETHAIRVFGLEHQLRKFHEEIGEALQAVNKFLNGAQEFLCSFPTPTPTHGGEQSFPFPIYLL